MKSIQQVLVTGGAGYVGSVLVPKLLRRGYRVRVLDWYLFGDRGLAAVADHANLEQIHADLRDRDAVRRAVTGCDAVIHLACVANDPSFELNPDLGKSINFDAFEPLVHESRDAGVRRFVYASSSSVYGISDAAQVTEDHPLKPLTDYSRFKMMCEPILLEAQTERFIGTVIRPATVCGYGPRQRLDVIVNILTNHAVHNRAVKVFGGAQKRPNLHIQDMTDLYVQLLEETESRIAGKIWNAGDENHTVAQLAEMVQRIVGEQMPEGGPITVTTTPTDDNRSYHVCSDLIKKELGFAPTRSIEQAVIDLVEAFKAGLLPDAMTDPAYYNIKMHQQLEAKEKDALKTA